MIALFSYGDAYKKVDFCKPMYISIPLDFQGTNPNCFFAPFPEALPVRSGDFIGSIDEGGPVNFKNIKINPHGNGTHTECQSHIYPGDLTITECIQNTLHFCRLISVYPTLMDNGDLCIQRQNLMLESENPQIKALAIRTLPNDESKKSRIYSGNNPPYLSEDAALAIQERGYEHLLIDLPSIDKEQDGGLLKAHKAFWKNSGNQKSKKTITELIFVPDKIKDGVYLLSMQIADFKLDVSPSRVALYKLE